MPAFASRGMRRMCVESAERTRDLGLLPDAQAAHVLRNAPIACSPRGIGLGVTGSTIPRIVNMGWVRVSISTCPHDGLPKLVTEKKGRHYIRMRRTVDGVRSETTRRFWRPGDGIEIGSEEYCRDYARACGVPALSDFEAALRTLKGDDLCLAAEVSAQKRAVRHSVEYDFVPGWFRRMYRKQRGLCAISRLPMYRENGKLCAKIPVPDRIESALGYVPGNVRLVRHGINMMRRDMTDEEFITMCATVATAAVAM